MVRVISTEEHKAAGRDIGFNSLNGASDIGSKFKQKHLLSPIKWQIYDFFSVWKSSVQKKQKNTGNRQSHNTLVINILCHNKTRHRVLTPQKYRDWQLPDLQNILHSIYIFAYNLLVEPLFVPYLKDDEAVFFLVDDFIGLR